MKQDPKRTELTSRRAFTKTLVTAAAVTPVVASLSCKTTNTTTSTKANATPRPDCDLKVVDGNGFTQTTWEIIPPHDHIPPMGIDGGGSIITDSKNRLRESGSGTGPYTYDDALIATHDRYGDIQALTIITELADPPYVSHAYYNAFQPGTKLCVWYQNIVGTASGDDTDYDPTVYNPADPDFTVRGGRRADGFQIVVKRKSLDYDKSHRKNRPNRYRHANIGGERHFRIGQWQVLNSANVVMFQHSGADNYRFYVEFGHYQP
jgi:hypothetical protein